MEPIDSYADRWIEAFNDGSDRFITELYAPDVRWEEKPSTFHLQGQAGDRAAAVAAVARRNELFRSPKATLHRALSAGVLVVIEYGWETTLRSSVMYADGRAVKAEVVGLHELNSDGLAERVTEYFVVLPSP